MRVRHLIYLILRWFLTIFFFRYNYIDLDQTHESFLYGWLVNKEDKGTRLVIEQNGGRVQLAHVWYDLLTPPTYHSYGKTGK